MKLFLILCLAFSFSAYADDHEGYYEPNVAEYYVSTFKALHLSDAILGSSCCVSVTWVRQD